MPSFVIHLKSATDRLYLIEDLKQHTTALEIWDAVPGGVRGCLMSHLTMYEEMLRRGESQWLVFEDDCEVLKAWPEFKVTSDVFLLGANEYVNCVRLELTPEGEEYAQVNRFWGTHAMIMTKEGAECILKAYRECHPSIPFDWLVNYAIEKKGLNVKGFLECKKYVRQKPGLKSDITGKIRQ